MNGKRKCIVWFRQDLRLHDNEAIHDALKHAEELLFVYVFDTRWFYDETRYGFRKTGVHRAKFIIESVEDLRQSLRAMDAELIVRVGKPEEEIYKIADEAKTSWVFCNRERTYEEEQVQDALEEKLWTIGQELRYSRGKMLYYTADLPFPVNHTPDVFTHFRKEVERYIKIRKPLPTPSGIVSADLNGMEAGKIPTLEDLNYEAPEKDERAVVDFVGGESAALERLFYYLWDTDLAKTYKETRNGLVGGDYSTKFSAWLAQGCISPKRIYQELKKYEAERGKNKSTYWIFFELLWRDFFRLLAKKYGNLIFLKGGTKQEIDHSWRDDYKLLQRWIDGETGIPFIDANMLELKYTGFMSNRGRQNVASFLVKDLKVNWQMGAEYFESMLVDYDPASNWGNWNYVAGVGSDPREDRYFNILKQARNYDPEGEYVKLWLPELAHLPSDKVHRPYRLSFEQQGQYGVKIGGNYPKAIINPKKWER
ncbi:MAG: DASH family cryptochrome [Bacteroidota bacterium]